MSHWLLDAIADRRILALREADQGHRHQEAGREAPALDEDLLRDTACMLEIAVLDLGADSLCDPPDQAELSRQAAADAFRILCLLPFPADPILAGRYLLRASVLAVLGDRGASATRWLRTLDESGQWPAMPLESVSWGERCQATLMEIWLRLVRQRDRSDRDAVLERVAALRSAQGAFERDYLRTFPAMEARTRALELIGIYHLAKAAEILAHDSAQTRPLLDSHFDRAVDAFDAAQLVEWGSMTRLLGRACARFSVSPI